MTSRKKSGKGKGKRNGRTKRGGFLKKLFDDSFSWFGNSETAKRDQTAQTETGSSEGGWFSNLINKFKPPTTPANPIPVIPGKPPAPLSQPASASSLPSAATPPSAATLSQPPPMQPAATLPSAATLSQAKGGKRRRSSIKKRK